MSGAVGKILIGAVIIGAAFLTGGASLSVTPGLLLPATGAALAGGLALSTTVIGGMALAIGAAEILSGVAQATSGKMKTPAVSLTQLDRLNASLDPTAPRKAVFGHTAMATDIRYVEPSGTDQEYIDYVICVASHKVEAIEQIWLEDALAWTSTGGAQGIYVGYLDGWAILEGGAAAYHTVNGGGNWGASQRLTGCASVHLRIKRSGTSSPFTGGLPGRMTIIGKGMPLYDPRRDSTVPGGSGTMRAADQTTWAYAPGGTEIGENIALQSLSWELGWKIGGKLAVGRGLPPERLDLAGRIAAANLCDEAVTLSAGGTQPRYHGAGVVSEGDDPGQIMQTFATACNGRYRESGGQLGLVIMHNDLALASTDPGLADDDMIGGFTWNPDPALEQSFNIVRGRFVDPSTASLYQLVDYPEVRIASLDGIDRVLTLDQPWREDAAGAQRIAKQTLERKLYGRSLSATWGLNAWRYKVGDVVPITLSALGMSRHLMRVETQEIRFDGTCPMTLVEENDAIYAWDADDSAPVTAAAPTVYNPLNNPIIKAIDTIELTPGASAFNLVADGSVTLTPNSITGPGAGTDFAQGAHTLEGYLSATCTFQSGDPTHAFVAGLDINPSGSESFGQVDWGFYMRSDGRYSIIESGTDNLYGTGGAYGSGGDTYTTDDVFTVQFEQSSPPGSGTLRYLKNGTAIYSRTDAWTDKAFFAASVCAAAQVNAITFSAGGFTGAHGADGAPGADGDPGPTGPAAYPPLGVAEGTTGTQTVIVPPGTNLHFEAAVATDVYDAAVANTAGQIQYSFDNGGSWSVFAAGLNVSDSNHVSGPGAADFTLRGDYFNSGGSAVRVLVRVVVSKTGGSTSYDISGFSQPVVQ